MAPIFVKTFEIDVRTGMFRFDTQIRSRRYISLCYKFDSVIAVSISILKTLLFYRNRLLMLVSVSCKNINRLVKSRVDILIFMHLFLICLLYASLPPEIMKYIEINMKIL